MSSDAQTSDAPTGDYDAIVIGAGVMGLAAAYHLTKGGARTLVVEAGPIPGGMAAHFDFDGVSLERFYHFICLTDFSTFELAEELGLGDAIDWKNTTMGYFAQGRVHRWGDPLALLRYPHLNLIDKIRYGLMAFWTVKRRQWGGVEAMTAPQWLRAWLGTRCYDAMWRTLLEQKFYRYTEQISATWIATRVQRIGRSRESLLKEKLGCFRGGTQMLVDALCEAIRRQGGEIRCGARVEEARACGDGVKSVRLAGGEVARARQVISTAPTPIAAAIFPELTQAERDKLRSIDNIGVVCLVYKLRKPVTGDFWLNIPGAEEPIPGLIEFSALRDFGEDHIVYAPYYMPIDEERWSWTDEALLDEAFRTIMAVNPDISEGDVKARMASRLVHSQPICTPNFLDRLPAIETSIEGVQIADTCYYYPEDRGVSESVRLGKRMAETALDQSGEPRRRATGRSA